MAASADTCRWWVVRGFGPLLGVAPGGPARFQQPVGGGGGRRWPPTLPQRRDQIHLFAYHHRIRWLDRSRGRHYSIRGDPRLQVGSTRQMASVPAASAGGLRRGLGDCRRVQCAHLRRRIRRVNRAGKFLHEPVCTAGFCFRDRHDGFAQLFRHSAMVHGDAYF